MQGSTPDEIAADGGYSFEPGEAEQLAATYAGQSPGDLKRASEELAYFQATPAQGAGALGLALLGFLLTRLIGVRDEPEATGSESA